LLSYFYRLDTACILLTFVAPQLPPPATLATYPTANITHAKKRPDSILVAAEVDTIIVVSSPQQARASTR
jgi:hypothetical protein